MAVDLVDEQGLTVAVIGTGFIGASIAKGLLESGFATQIVGEDIDSSALQQASITRRLDLAQDAQVVDIWVLAVPPDSVGPWLERIAALAQPGAVITDTTSVKESIYACIPDGLRSRFVGGHPLIGGHQHGCEVPNPHCFADQHWILIPGDADDTTVKRIEQMVFALDAIPVHMTASDHDRHLAMLSHLPATLAGMLGGLERDLSFAHISDSNWPIHTGTSPELWAQVLMHNRDEVRLAILALEGRLQELLRALESGDKSAISQMLSD